MNPTVELSDTVKRLKSVADRDFELWGVGVFIMTALLLGLLALLTCVPWAESHVGTSLPQLVTGLVALLVLSNAYLISQKRTLHRTTDVLLQQFTSDLVTQKYSFVDSTTQLFAREYLDFALGHEILRAHQHGSALTFVLMRIQTLGTGSEEEGLVQAARLLRSNFRGADILVRHDSRTVIAMLPETSEQQAKAPLQRLNAKIEEWNISSSAPFELVVEHRVHGYKASQPPMEVLNRFMAEFDTITPSPRIRLNHTTTALPPVAMIH